jgi:magnesium transporter
MLCRPDDSVKVWELLDKEQGDDVLDEMSEALQESLDEEPDEAATAAAGDLQGALQAGDVTRKPVMINAFELQNGRLRQIQVDCKEDLAATAPIWVDLLAPSKEERRWVEDIFGLELPDADDLKDLEESARFYIEDSGDVHMHSDFLLDKEDESRNVPVAFVLHNNILFSMRDEELPVFRLQRLRARIQPGYVTDGKDVLLDLYDADVEYSADALEDIYAELEKVSRTVLTPQVTDDEAAEILSDIAKEEDLNGRIRRNVLDTRRALSFLMRSRLMSTAQHDDARQILRDIDSLDGHTSFLFGKINFLMDATVGFININQNKRVSQADHHQRGVRPAQHHRRHRRHERVLDDDRGGFLAVGLRRLHARHGPDRLGHLRLPALPRNTQGQKTARRPARRTRGLSAVAVREATSSPVSNRGFRPRSGRCRPGAPPREIH